MVTLDGQVINAGGSFTGGSTARSVGVFSRKQELDELRSKLTKLEQKRTEAEKELAARKAEVDNLSAQLAGAEGEGMNAATEHVRANLELERLTKAAAQNEETARNIEQEIAAYEKQLRQHYSTKSRLMEEIDSLDPDDRHFIARKSDLDDRLYKMYDKIEEVENGLMDARAKKQAIEADKITGDNIYKILICFDKLYATMTEAERRRLVEILIDEVQIYPERQPNGQWLKSVRFKLPIIDHDLELSLDNKDRVEAVGSLVRVKYSSLRF